MNSSSKQIAAARYMASPNLCDVCSDPIPLRGRSPSAVRRLACCSKACRLSALEDRAVILEMTKGEVFQKYTNWQNARSQIQKHARRRYRLTSESLECAVCRYDLHVEICHVIPVSQWPDQTPISVINDTSNMVALCPNHHWEFDNGVLVLSDLHLDAARQNLKLVQRLLDFE